MFPFSYDQRKVQTYIINNNARRFYYNYLIPHFKFHFNDNITKLIIFNIS